jgi:hypothetical protein
MSQEALDLLAVFESDTTTFLSEELDHEALAVFSKRQHVWSLARTSSRGEHLVTSKQLAAQWTFVVVWMTSGFLSAKDLHSLSRTCTALRRHTVAVRAQAARLKLIVDLRRNETSFLNNLRHAMQISAPLRDLTNVIQRLFCFSVCC